MGHFVHLVAEVLNVLSRFVCEPHYLQGSDKRANGRRVDLLLILDNDVEELGGGGVLPEVVLIFFQISSAII